MTSFLLSITVIATLIGLTKRLPATTAVWFLLTAATTANIALWLNFPKLMTGLTIATIAFLWLARRPENPQPHA